MAFGWLELLGQRRLVPPPATSTASSATSTTTTSAPPLATTTPPSSAPPLATTTPLSSAPPLATTTPPSSTTPPAGRLLGHVLLTLGDLSAGLHDGEGVLNGLVDGISEVGDCGVISEAQLALLGGIGRHLEGQAAQGDGREGKQAQFVHLAIELPTMLSLGLCEIFIGLLPDWEWSQNHDLWTGDSGSEGIQGVQHNIEQK